jgi:extradiol dioxygenase family protein
VPGGRVDILPAQETLRGSRGAAIDHIGFEVEDMDAFADRMSELGIAFDFGPTAIDAINLEIAFITDPVGTYIEITEGLDDVE